MIGWVVVDLEVKGIWTLEYSLGSYIFPFPLSIACGSRPHGRYDLIEKVVEETGSLELVGTSYTVPLSMVVQLMFVLSCQLPTVILSSIID
jgi:hypothetical protein